MYYVSIAWSQVISALLILSFYKLLYIKCCFKKKKLTKISSEAHTHTYIHTHAYVYLLTDSRLLRIQPSHVNAKAERRASSNSNKQLSSAK